jgi:hypothetical protein
MGCPGCLPGQSDKDETYASVQLAAKREAIQKGYPVAIVWEDNEWKLYNAFYAYDNGLSPLIKEVVSNG